MHDVICNVLLVSLIMLFLATFCTGGSQIIWTESSGGRDRPDPLTGEWCPVRSLAYLCCSSSSSSKFNALLTNKTS
jgi:hypothetical protein